MKIKITCQQLKTWIKEGILKCLTENSHLITEMAVERKMYVNECFFISSRLAEHVLLIACCKLYDRENQNLQHWKGEVVAFCRPITEVLLKNVSKANQISVKKKVLTKTWIEGFEITSNRILNSHWQTASRKEKINGIWTVVSGEEKITSVLTEDMVKTYTNIIRNLINYISNSNITELENYIYSL